jgi:hypothetical protein
MLRENINDLIALAAVAEERSFTRAAARLNGRAIRRISPASTSIVPAASARPRPSRWCWRRCESAPDD